jgi:hypothetical protein
MNRKQVDIEEYEINIQSLFSSETYKKLHFLELKYDSGNYMDTQYTNSEDGINDKMLMILTNWLFEVENEYDLGNDLIFLALYIMKLYLSEKSVTNVDLQGLGVTCVFIACKFLEYNTISSSTLSSLTDGAITPKGIIDLEIDILETTQFTVMMATPYSFLQLIKPAITPSEYDISLFIISLMMHHYVTYLPSVIVKSVLSLVLSRTFDVEKNEQEQICNCNSYIVKMMTEYGENKHEGFDFVWNKHKKLHKYKLQPTLNVVKTSNKYVCPEYKPIVRRTHYRRISKIGSGNYGTVYEVADPDNHKYALKFTESNDIYRGIALSAIREVAIMKELDHTNIIKLIDFQIETGNSVIVNIIMENMKMNMRQYIKNNEIMSLENFQLIARQLIDGIAYMHNFGIIHRDLKPENILLSGSNVVKIADLGMCRFVLDMNKCMTPVVATLWYRSPELLLNQSSENLTYGGYIDMWAIGCILAEIWRCKPLFCANSQIGMLEKIFKLFGTPTEETWKGVSTFPDMNDIEFTIWPSKSVRTVLPRLEDDDAIDFLEQLLILDPSKRMTADEAKTHPFLTKKITVKRKD